MDSDSAAVIITKLLRTRERDICRLIQNLLLRDKILFQQPSGVFAV